MLKGVESNLDNLFAIADERKPDSLLFSTGSVFDRPSGRRSDCKYSSWRLKTGAKGQLQGNELGAAKSSLYTVESPIPRANMRATLNQGDNRPVS